MTGSSASLQLDLSPLMLSREKKINPCAVSLSEGCVHVFLLSKNTAGRVEGACYPSDPALLASGSLPPAGQGARPSFLQTLKASVSRCVAGAEEPLPGIDIKLLGLEMIAEVLARAPVWHSLPPALNRLLRKNDCSVPK